MHSSAGTVCDIVMFTVNDSCLLNVINRSIINCVVLFITAVHVILKTYPESSKRSGFVFGTH